MSNFLKPPFPRLQKSHPNTQGLVGLWAFNEGAGNKIFDISGNKNHAVLTNMDPATDWVSSPFGWALDFDGTNDVVDLGTPTYIPTQSTHNYTLMIRVLGRATTNEQGLIGWSGTANTSEPFCALILQGGEWRFLDRNNAAANSKLLVTPATANIWTHLVGTKNGDDFKLYVNGVLVDSVTSAYSSSGNYSERNYFFIGSTNNGATKSNAPLNGMVTNAAVWDRALTSKEIRELYFNPNSLFKKANRSFLYKSSSVSPTIPVRRRRVILM